MPEFCTEPPNLQHRAALTEAPLRAARCPPRALEGLARTQKAAVMGSGARGLVAGWARRGSGGEACRAQRVCWEGLGHRARSNRLWLARIGSRLICRSAARPSRTAAPTAHPRDMLELGSV